MNKKNFKLQHLTTILTFKQFFIICLFFCASCKESKKINDDIVDIIEINVDNTLDLSFQELFTDNKPISLEFTEESMIGGINQLYIYDHRLYVLDTQGAKGVLVFDESGKFIKKIGQNGNGPGEYLQPNYFQIDSINKEIEILSYLKISYYTLNGEFLRDLNIDIEAMQYYKTNNNYYFPLMGSKEYNLIQTDHKGKQKNQYIKAEYDMIMRSEPLCFVQNSNIMLMYRPFLSYKLYEITDDDAIPARVVDFGKYNFVKEKYDALTTMEQMKFNSCKTNVNQAIIFRYVENKTFIHIVYNVSSTYFYYIFNKETGNSLNFKRSSLVQEYETDGSPLWLVYYDDNYFYYVIESYRFKSTKQIKDFLMKLGLNENSIDSIIFKPSNPIILRTKYNLLNEI